MNPPQVSFSLSSQHCAKLASLLALSTGAFGLAPEASAQITWSGALDVKVGFGGGDLSSYAMDVPGNGDVRIARGTGYGNRYVGASRVNHAVPMMLNTDNFNANLVNAGRRWGTLGIVDSGSGMNDSAGLGLVRSSDNAVLRLGDFSHKYVAFRFPDTTAGNALRYGWMELSGSIGGANTPSITLHSWAYDASGAEILMGSGAVPEPQAAALATGAALLLGAAGLRAWRQRRATA